MRKGKAVQRWIIIIMMFAPPTYKQMCLYIRIFDDGNFLCHMCKRNSSDVFISFFISDMSGQEMCFETCLPINIRWQYFHTTQAVPRNDNVFTRYVCFVCLYCVFHCLAATALRLNFELLPLTERYIVHDVIECIWFRVLFFSSDSCNTVGEFRSLYIR